MTIELSHESSNLLLPWYANGTLSAEECPAVELHLKNCAACQSELQWLREVSGSMTDLANEAPAVEPSLAKALAAVDKWEQSKSSPSHPFSKWFGAIWNPTVPVARYAMAAQFALIVGLCAFLWISHHQTKPAYTTLSGPVVSTSAGARLTVSFAPNATFDQVSRILGDIDGNIISGPSANGICIVQLPADASKDADVQATIQKLRANNLIRYVEQLP